MREVVMWRPTVTVNRVMYMPTDYRPETTKEVIDSTVQALQDPELKSKTHASASHLLVVKHTANIVSPTLRSWLIMVMMNHLTSHANARLAGSSCGQP